MLTFCIVIKFTSIVILLQKVSKMTIIHLILLILLIPLKMEMTEEKETAETAETKKSDGNLFKDIFNICNSYTKIFKDKRKISPEYIPLKLPGREKDCTKMASVLSDAFSGCMPMNIFIYGMPGTGKTSVIKRVFDEMEKFQKKNGHNENKLNKVKIITKYINCREKATTEYQVLLRILEDERLKEIASGRGSNPDNNNEDKIYGYKLDGLAVEKLYEFLEKVLKRGKIALLVSLDEVDAIRKNFDKDNLFYNLVRMNSSLNDNLSDNPEESDNFNGGIAIISTTNDMKFKEKLDPRTRSSLSKKDIFFERYEASQLEKILEERKNLAFYDGTVEKSAINYAAGYVRKTYDGDVRYALNLFQIAGEITEKEGKSKVTHEEVRKGCDVVNVDTLNEGIKRLYKHLIIVLYAVADAIFKKRYKRLIDIHSDAILSGEAYEAYEEKCKELGEKAKTMRWFREYLNDLQKGEFLALSESGKGVRGNTTIISVGKYYTPKEVVERVEKLLLNEEVQKEEKQKEGTE